MRGPREEAKKQRAEAGGEGLKAKAERKALKKAESWPRPKRSEAKKKAERRRTTPAQRRRSTETHSTASPSMPTLSQIRRQIPQWQASEQQQPRQGCRQKVDR
jgi:hypothetical protein